MLDHTRREDPWPGGEPEPVLLGRIAVEWGLLQSGALVELMAERDRLKGAGREVPLSDLLARRAGLDRGTLLRLAQEVHARSARPTEDPPRLDRYEVLDTIGRGGMGRVVRARDAGLGRIVALKLLERGLDDDERSRKRFLREARAAARLQHPNVVAVHDVGEADGRAFLVMELVGGGSLDKRLTEPYDLAEMVGRLEKVARAVHAAHDAGIVHRDLKPGNILLTPEGEPKVADFGLAFVREKDSLVTRSGAMLGTPLYMAPEQFEPAGREIDRRTDVYALGAILYQVLTGRPPHLGSSTVDQCWRVLHAEPVPPRRLDPSIPWPLEAIALKALEKRPGDRYQTAAELAEDLERSLHDEPIRARRITALRRIRLWARRHRAPLATASVASAAVVVTVLWAVWLGPQRAGAARRDRLAWLESEADRLAAEESARLAEAGPEEVLAGAVPERVAGEVHSRLAPEGPEEEAAVARGLASYRAGPLLARAHLELGHWAAAYRYDPEGATGVRARLEIARQLAGAGRNDEAAAILRRLLGRGLDAPVLELLGRSLYESGDLARARVAFELAGEDGTPARLAGAFGGELQAVSIPGLGGVPPRAPPERVGVLPLERRTVVLFRRAGRPAFEIESDGRLVPVASPMAAIPAGDLVVDVQAADVDGDRSPELAVALERPNGGAGFALLAHRTGEWRLEALELGHTAHAESLAAGDLDGDGDDEVVVLFSWEAEQHWAIDFPGPRIQPFRPDGVRSWAFAPLAGDLDGDGAPELFLGRSGQLEGEAQVLPPPDAERVAPVARLPIGQLVDSLLLEPGSIAVLADLDRNHPIKGDDALAILSWRGGRLEERVHHSLGSDQVGLGSLSAGRILGRPVVVADGRSLIRVLFLDEPDRPPVIVPIARGVAAALEDVDGDGSSELLLLEHGRLVVRGQLTEDPELADVSREVAGVPEPRLLLAAARDLIGFGAREEAFDLLGEVARRFDATPAGDEALRLAVETRLSAAARLRAEAVGAIRSRRFGDVEAAWSACLEAYEVALREARSAADRVASRPDVRRRLLAAQAEACRWRLDWAGWRDALATSREAAPGLDAPDPGPATELVRLFESDPVVDGPPGGSSLAVDAPARTSLEDGRVAVVFDSVSARHAIGIPIDFGGGSLEWEIDLEVEGSVWGAELHLGLVPGLTAGSVSLFHHGTGDWATQGGRFSVPGLATVHLDRFGGRWAIRYASLPQAKLVLLEIRDLEDGGRLVSREWGESSAAGLAPGRYVFGVSIGDSGISDAFLGSSVHPTTTTVRIGTVRLRTEPGRSAVASGPPRSADELHRAAGENLLRGDLMEAARLYREVLEREPARGSSRVHLALAGGTAEEFLRGFDVDPYGFGLAIDDALRGAPAAAHVAIGERLRAGLERHPGPCLAFLGDVEEAAAVLTGDDPSSRYLRLRGKTGEEGRLLGDYQWLVDHGLRPPVLDPPPVHWAPAPGDSAASLREAYRGAMTGSDAVGAWIALSRLLLLDPADGEVRLARIRLAGAFQKVGLAEVDLRELGRLLPGDPGPKLHLALHFARVRARRETVRYLGEAIAAGLDRTVLVAPECREAFEFLAGDPEFERLTGL